MKKIDRYEFNVRYNKGVTFTKSIYFDGDAYYIKYKTIFKILILCILPFCWILEVLIISFKIANRLWMKTINSLKVYDVFRRD